VTVKSLSASVSSEGGGGSALRGAIAAPAITLNACTVSQDAVARAMARLRAVQGVTRVSLAKSAKGGDAGASSGDQSGIGCPGANPPDFQVTMFFEGAAAATAAAAANGDPAAAASTAAGAASSAASSATASATSTPSSGGTS
jgi:hypothetical protein